MGFVAMQYGFSAIQSTGKKMIPDRGNNLSFCRVHSAAARKCSRHRSVAAAQAATHLAVFAETNGGWRWIRSRTRSLREWKRVPKARAMRRATPGSARPRRQGGLRNVSIASSKSGSSHGMSTGYPRSHRLSALRSHSAGNWTNTRSSPGSSLPRVDGGVPCSAA